MKPIIFLLYFIFSENPRPQSPLSIPPKSSPKSTKSPQSKRRKIAPMTETQSKMVSLHERQINEKIQKNNELVNLEMQLIQTKLKNEEERHKLQLEQLNLSIENEQKKKYIKDLKIKKLKFEIEKLLTK
jgi:hypothetical protein